MRSVMYSRWSKYPALLPSCRLAHSLGSTCVKPLSKRFARSTVFALVFVWASHSAFSDTVHLVDGDVLNGKILESNADAVVLDHKVLGELSIPRADIAEILYTDSAIEEEGEEVDAESAADEPAATTEPEPAESAKASRGSGETEAFKLYNDKFGSRLIRLELALDGSQGNTDEQSTRAKVEYSVRKNLQLRGVEATYYLKIKEDDRTDNKFVLEGNQIWLRADSRWMIIGNVRFDYDEFESWEERVSLRLGPGYRFYDTEKLWFAVASGLGGRREFGSQNDDWKAEASLGTDLVWQISARQSFEFDLFGWVVVDDPDDYRGLSHLGWRIMLNEKLKLSLVTGLSLEYQAIVDPDKEHYDFRNFLGLSFQF